MTLHLIFKVLLGNWVLFIAQHSKNVLIMYHEIKQRIRQTIKSGFQHNKKQTESKKNAQTAPFFHLIRYLQQVKSKKFVKKLVVFGHTFYSASTFYAFICDLFFVGTLNEKKNLRAQQTISTPLRMENPVRRPIVPPISPSADSMVT